METSLLSAAMVDILNLKGAYSFISAILHSMIHEVLSCGNHASRVWIPL